MRNQLFRNTAVALGLGVCSVTTVAHADNGYTAPARWNNFRAVSERNDLLTLAQDSVTELPAPTGSPDGTMLLPDGPKLAEPNLAGPSHSQPKLAEPVQGYSTMPGAGSAPMQPQPMATPYDSHSMAAPVGAGCDPTYASPYAQAMSSPWDGATAGDCSTGACGTNTLAAARPALFPWFGSANLLFFTLEENGGRQVATGLGNDFNTSLVDPGFAPGFDVQGGRYFDCGRYGFGIGYFNWNPGSDSVTRQGTAGTIRATMPQYRDVNLNLGGAGIDSVYSHIDGTAGGGGIDPGAAAVRIRRDISFQGIEANLFSFGLMGAQRAAYAGCGDGTLLGLGHGRGFGGAAGPLVRANTGRVRVMTSHGFRWMQVEDSLELAFNRDGTAGYQAEDIYDNVDVENNLFGYQFGGRLTYCLGNRLDLNIGGKFGIYGNHAEVRHRLGTETQLAYLTTSGTDDILTESSDTVLSTLGELDLGLGYRLNNAWTIRGGYRVMGITGVATAVDAFPQHYASVAGSGEVRANDSFLLHGGYVGLDFNW